MTPLPSVTVVETTMKSPAQEQTALMTEGQRKVNLIWEFTQAFIALTVVLTNLFVYIHVAFGGSESKAPTELSAVMFLVVGFYFGRTNHTAVGGTGAKHPNEER
jgi:hypothetical protein